MAENNREPLGEKAFVIFEDENLEIVGSKCLNVKKNSLVKALLI